LWCNLGKLLKKSLREGAWNIKREGFRISAPFKRTLNQAKEKGFVKTTSSMLVLSLRRILAYIHPLPDCSIVEVNKSKMLLYPKKGAIHRELFLYKKREPICTDYLMRSTVLKEGDFVLDIGANIGYYVLVESQLIGKSGKIYAVEPVHSNFELLKKNIELNNLKTASAFQFAFGDQNTTSKIYVSDRSNWCAMNKAAVSGTIIGEEEVSVKTVDTFFKDKAPPNFVRMDVEGYEYQIIKGMTKTLKGDVKILAELHPLRSYLEPEKMQELFDILEQYGFRVRFAVFEDKVVENKLVRILLKKAGSKLPLVASNISIRELKKMIDDNPGIASPNVFFEKSHATKNRAA
jgi:FkbM family methyltransferase